LFKIKPDGTGKTPLTNLTNLPSGSGFTYSLVWTPDNSTILNAARLNGMTGIYKIDANGSGGVLGRVPTTPGQPVEWVGGIVPPFEEKEIAAWGGGASQGEAYTLVNTIGQAFAGQISSGERFNLQSGFWTYDAPRRTLYDFDGDRKTDIGIFRPSDGSWWYSRSSDNDFRVFRFGDFERPDHAGDFTGDGLADIAVFRATSGEWFVQRSEDISFYSIPFGTSGDVPAPGDYDGDGKFDTGVFRPSTGNWFVQRSTVGILIATFGINGDQPVPSAFVP